MWAESSKGPTEFDEEVPIAAFTVPSPRFEVLVQPIAFNPPIAAPAARRTESISDSYICP
jgi:hypothetical protein